MTTKDLLVTAVLLLTFQGSIVVILLYLAFTTLRDIRANAAEIRWQVYSLSGRSDQTNDSPADEPVGTYQPAAVDHWYQTRRPLPPDLDEP